jgi:hypothetical protein
MGFRIKAFIDQKFKKIYSWKKNIFIYKKIQFTYHFDSRKDLQATGKAFSSQKENIQHFETRNFLTFFQFFVSFAILDPIPFDQTQ